MYPPSKVLFVTPEFEDFVRVGGLASVSAALPRALRSCADVRLVIPAYRSVLAQITNLEILAECPPFAQMPACSIARTATKDGLPIYLVICPQLFDREGTPYGDAQSVDWSDNDVRFARFCSAAALLAAGGIDPTWSADVVHANDWQSALVPAYLEWSSIGIPTLLTIHNLAYQGLFSKDTLGRIGAPDSSFDVNGLEFHNRVSFLKAGLYYSSHLTTVSETYAREITTPSFGCGLDGLLRVKAEANQLTGILNGIDDTWDPSVCPELPTPFETGDWSGKQANTEHIRKEFKLAISRGPLFGLVARLVHQKGVDLVLSAAETIVSSGGQLVVMGRGEPEFEARLQSVAAKRPDAIGVTIGFEDSTARQIFAGSDFTLMPSRFEPCGLSQMYAQRFGSLPIGHNTGGLADTITDGKTGFLFNQPSMEFLLGSICRAFGTFGRSDMLNSMREAAMAKTYGWGERVTAYNMLYRQLAS